MADPYFCDREAEIKVLRARMEQGIHVFVLSPRRYGKTSLLQRARAAAVSNGAAVGYAHLLFATSEGEVATTLLSAVVNVASGRARARRYFDDLLRRIRVVPSISYDTSGQIRLTVEPALARPPPGSSTDVAAPSRTTSSTSPWPPWKPPHPAKPSPRSESNRASPKWCRAR